MIRPFVSTRRFSRFDFPFFGGGAKNVGGSGSGDGKNDCYSGPISSF